MNKFHLDFSKIDLVALKKLGITRGGIENVFAFENDNSNHFGYANFIYVIAFTSDRNIIHIAYRISKSVTFDIELLQVDLPEDENDIKKYWCRG